MFITTSISIICKFVTIVTFIRSFSNFWQNISIIFLQSIYCILAFCYKQIFSSLSLEWIQYIIYISVTLYTFWTGWRKCNTMRVKTTETIGAKTTSSRGIFGWITFKFFSIICTWKPKFVITYVTFIFSSSENRVRSAIVLLN